MLQRGILEEIVFSDEVDNDMSTYKNGVGKVPILHYQYNPEMQFEFHDIVFCVRFSQFLIL